MRGYGHLGKLLAGLAVLAVTLLGGSTLAGSCGSSTPDIVDTAAQAGSFDTLLAAATAAGLVDALRGDGPLTVFAPTDDAFAKLARGTVESLLEPENRERLAAILTYHVAPGELTADKVVELDRIRTLNGQRPAVTVQGSDVMVGAARVIKTDIAASNGVIHVIDTVLLPSDKDIIGTAVEAGSFGTLAAALDAAGLVRALQGDGPFTVFAPTDAAFARLPRGTVESLLKPENKDRLTAILTYHVVAGDIYSADAFPGRVRTLEGSGLRVSADDGALMIDQARVISADIATTNGVIHVIDEVIMPESLRAAATDPARELIRMAIERGAPLYNHNQPEACTAVYEVAAQALMASSDFRLSDDDRSTLEHAMERSARTHDSREQAWIMRRALDDVMESRDRMSM